MSFKRNSCLRKIRHVNFLTAMQHATRLVNDGRLVIYPCDFCGGLHIGHVRRSPTTSSAPALDRAQIEKRIERSRRRVLQAVAQTEALVGSSNDIVSRAHQRLRDRQRHLESLQQSLSDIPQLWATEAQADFGFRERTAA